MPELVKRVLSALVAAPVFLILTWLGGWVFAATLVVLAVIVQLEIISMLEKQNVRVLKIAALSMGVPVLLLGIVPGFAWSLFLVLLLATLTGEVFRTDKHPWHTLIATLAVAVMVPALFSGLLLLREMGNDHTGFLLTLTLLLMVWANDVFAYFGGKLTGRRKLAPKISPSKTVEGFLWGFLGTLIMLFLCMHFLPDFPLNLAAALPFAVIVGFMGPAGDLAESKLKRASEVKDSSELIPGHGGMYDRFDAVLFSAPAAMAYFQVLAYFSII
ncbi:phosphatidate cytidylyltransferase [Balneolales bacterium ANBcel1]|nr:phosphatidate cytidylyltransferase [Balneolales bacterium ANBcel1]